MLVLAIRRPGIQRVNVFPPRDLCAICVLYRGVVAMSDQQFRAGVGLAGIVLVAIITVVRFCGSMSLPPKSQPPHVVGKTESQILSTKSGASPAEYEEFLAKDALSLGVRTPSIADMSKKLVYRVDEARHVLEVGQPAIELAGLRIVAMHTDEAIDLKIENRTSFDVAYQVVSTPVPAAGNCNSARPLPFNAMVIAKGQSETRTECAWHDGIAIAVTKVETLELTPIESFYIEQVSPLAVGIEDRIAHGHHVDGSVELCSEIVPQVVRSGLDRGEIGWRDLIDFYARHRCRTYLFPSTYRAFKSDGEQQLPVITPGM